MRGRGEERPHKAVALAIHHHIRALSPSAPKRAGGGVLSRRSDDKMSSQILEYNGWVTEHATS